MSQLARDVVLDPENVAAWADVPFEALFSLPRDQVESSQRGALVRRFETLRSEIAALDKLASRQGVDRITGVEDAAPVFFDHRVYKSYPLSLLEKRQFDRLTAWMRRLTVHDLTTIPLAGLKSVDSWLDRLDEYGMIVGHSTGTTGKLSFIPRSQTEWPAWTASYFEIRRAATGVDTLKVNIPSFQTGYRRATIWRRRCSGCSPRSRPRARKVVTRSMTMPFPRICCHWPDACGPRRRRGELDQLDIDPKLLEERAQLIERSRHRDEDLQRWFTELAGEFRGQRVRITAPRAIWCRWQPRAESKGWCASSVPTRSCSPVAGSRGSKIRRRTGRGSSWTSSGSTGSAACTGCQSAWAWPLCAATGTSTSCRTPSRS